MFEKVEESNTSDIKTDQDIEELSPVMKRKQKEIGNPDFALSIRNSIRKMVAEFSLTCYKDMAEGLVNP